MHFLLQVTVYFFKRMSYTQQKDSAQFFCDQKWLHLILYIVVREIILHFQIEIRGTLTKLYAFKVSRGHPSKVAK